MFTDYVTLLLTNAAAGLFLLACYLYWGLDDQDQGRWSPAFLVPGVVLIAGGMHMVFTWPLPGPYNSAYGEMSVLFGALLAGAGIALWKSRNLLPVAIYGLFAGAFAVVAGIRFIHLGLSNTPVLAGAAFILSGMGGIFALPVLYFRKNKRLRIAGGVILILASAILALTALGGLWMHMEVFSKWLPAGMK